MVSYQPQSSESSTTSSGGLRTSLDQGHSLPLVEEVHLPFQDLRMSPPQVSRLSGLVILPHLTFLKTPSPSPSRRFHPYFQRAVPRNPQQWLCQGTPADQSQLYLYHLNGGDTELLL